MKIAFTLTDENGRIFTGTADLRLDGGRRTRLVKSVSPASQPSHEDLDFKLNPRAFMRRYARGKSGAKRFALVVAFLSRGNSGVGVPYADIIKTWNSMKALLGGAYNPAHSTRAKDRGWVDTTKLATYRLGDSWKEELA